MTAHVIPSFSQAGGEIRRPAVAGRFYPADPDTLRSEVNRFLSEAGTDSISSVRAIIVPHAGYVFSGATASKAYACIAPSAHYRRVFLLGPSHRAAFDGASVNGVSPAYATPLGEVKVDQETCERLAHSDDVFCYLPQAHQKEHCLEVQLPFSSKGFRAFRLLCLSLWEHSGLKSWNVWLKLCCLILHPRTCLSSAATFLTILLMRMPARRTRQREMPFFQHRWKNSCVPLPATRRTVIRTC